jgi:DNA-binding transcriptional ArsR family regulator
VLIINLEYLSSKCSFDEVFSSKGRSKILKILALREELNISKIVEETGSNHTSVSNHLRYLISKGFLQEKSFGRIRIYRYRTENILANNLKQLILFWEEWTGAA